MSRLVLCCCLILGVASAHAVSSATAEPATERSARAGVDAVPRPATIAEAVDAALSIAVANDTFSGAVLVARGDERLFARAYGMADREAGRRNTLDTPFNLGSMNKMFTAVGIAQLVERGLLSYDDAVGAHVPDYPDADIASNVTLHHLLTHTSGLGSYWNDRYTAARDSLRTVEGFAALFRGDAPAFAPGSGVLYSNAGPVVLGIVIERASGSDYYEFIKRYVYAPAGMYRSGHFFRDDTDAGFAHGYLRIDGRWQRNTQTLALRGSPAGGGYASVNDLHRFSRALMSDRLVAVVERERLTSAHVELGQGVRYGYGFGIHGEGTPLRYVGHNGGAPGISAEFAVYTELDYTIVVLANFDRAAGPIASQIHRIIALSEAR